ncbi:unnamed protein product [Pedinophyceae sp. YPF-701]|nr:unnamed protein product [Pedinophyceae sp. YPF-701]
MLKHKEDFYGGVIVDGDALPSDAARFEAELDASLESWRATGKRGVWLKVPTQQSHLIPLAVARGFIFHHAEPSHAMLTNWLPDTPSTLPANASHQVGVGAFVINSKREVLVVQERSGPLRGKGVWKMPTGLVSQGEDVVDAAVREVHEECGIAAEFECVLAIRQMHRAAFGKSDLFFVLGCRAVDEAAELVAQESEIEACRWLPLEEYEKIEFFRGRPLYEEITRHCAAWARGQAKGMHGARLGTGRETDELLFFPMDEELQSNL